MEGSSQGLGFLDFLDSMGTVLEALKQYNDKQEAAVSTNVPSGFGQQMANMAASTPAPAQSIGGSFQVANVPTPPRLILALDGLEKEGKTHFALTAPGPIAYCAFDIGDEGVIDKFQTKKVIHKADYFVNVPKGVDQASMMKLVEPVWDQFLADWKVAMLQMKQGHIRTLILDTGSEAWEVLRLARFGKLTQIMPHNYTALNTEYRNLIREAFNTPGNLIILHKLKAQWIDNPATGKGSKTGQYERAGYADTGFLVQVNALAYRERNPETGQKTGAFHVQVRDCRQNPLLNGQDFAGPVCSFPFLGAAVFPGTDPFTHWGLDPSSL